MTISDHENRALHFTGGNYFDDMRINISESHRIIDNSSRNVKKLKRSKYRNFAKLYLTGIAIKLGIHEFLIVSGIRRKWLDNFRSYWSGILNGRPFWNTIDFFLLLYDYRKCQQETSQLQWKDTVQHFANWQNPNQIYSTLQSTRVLATNPIVCLKLWKSVQKTARILEYGCSLAPYYYCYREYFSHLECKWTLADIPNFPFHYAKFLYKDDSDVEFVTINNNNYLNPLGEKESFDIIILTAVFEHLDDPIFVSEYLFKKLKIDGLFVFDYIKSEGKGLDHPKALEMRDHCLKIIFDKTQIVYGEPDDINKSQGFWIVKKKIA